MGTRRGPSVVWSLWGCSVNLGFLLRSELLVFEVLSYISCAARKGDLRDFLLSLAFISCDISDMTEFILLGLWWISWPYVIKRVIFSHWFLFSSLLLLFSRDSALFLFITFFFLLWERDLCLPFCISAAAATQNSCWVLPMASSVCYYALIPESLVFKIFFPFSLLPHIHTFLLFWDKALL